MNNGVLDTMMGYLALIVGPMFSGKTTKLIRFVNKYKTLDKKILVINHVIDNRYIENTICTHNYVNEKSISLSNLSYVKQKFKEDYDKADVLIVDEAQFFKDLVPNVLDWVDNDKKIVYVAGLKSDFRKEKFGDIYDLLPHCDKVYCLTALCKQCGDGTEAPFTKRTVVNNNQTLVGEEDVYQAVCRKHYGEPNTELENEK